MINPPGMLKKKLQNHQTVLGTWCEIPSPSAANVIAKSGMDFVIIDLEHGPMDYKVAQEMTMAVEAEGCEAIIRVPKNEESGIVRSLDIGASGIIVPHIRNVKDRDLAIRFAKFPPVGERSYNPYIRSFGYSPEALRIDAANKNSLLALILEDEKSILALEHIVDHPAIDVVYLGIYDLAVSMGYSRNINNVKVRKLVAEAIKKIRKNKKAAGCMVHNKEEFRYYKKLGVTFFVYTVDSSVMYEAYKNVRDTFK